LPGHEDASLEPSHFLWSVPLIRVLGGLEEGEELREGRELVLDLIECLNGLLVPERGLSDLLGQYDTAWVKISHSALEDKMEPLLQHVAELYSKRGGEGISEREKYHPEDHNAVAQASASIAQGLQALLGPMVYSAFVGHLNPDACLFCWDQALMAGFTPMVPRLAAMVAAALCAPLMACSTFQVLGERLRELARYVTVEQLQDWMRKCCLDELREELQVGAGMISHVTAPDLEEATELFERAYKAQADALAAARAAEEASEKKARERAAAEKRATVEASAKGKGTKGSKRAKEPEKSENSSERRDGGVEEKGKEKEKKGKEKDMKKEKAREKMEKEKTAGSQDGGKGDARRAPTATVEQGSDKREVKDIDKGDKLAAAVSVEEHKAHDQGQRADDGESQRESKRGTKGKDKGGSKKKTKVTAEQKGRDSMGDESA
ncbi:unnamed protein product, partial [Chrysoparadoxa australica]